MPTELLNLVVTAAMVIVGALLTYVLAIRQRNYEALIEAKLRHYEAIAPLLNTIYRYRQCIGDYLERTPEEILDVKRRADEEFFVHSYIWGPAFRRAYAAFMAASFLLYVRPRALIRAPRSAYATQPKLPGWKGFTDELVDRAANTRRYEDLMAAIAEDLPFVHRVRRSRRTGPSRTYRAQRRVEDELTRAQGAAVRERTAHDNAARTGSVTTTPPPAQAPSPPR